MNKLEIFNNWASKQTTEVRNNAIGINWYTINNAQLVNSGISPNTCERWTDMFTILEDGSFKESYYISDLMRLLFGNINLGSTPGFNTFYGVTNKTFRKVKTLIDGIQSKIIKDGDWIIFTSVGNDIHTKLKKLIESVASSDYEVEIMDGGDENRIGTSNASCERLMKMHSEEARKGGKNKKMIFVSSIMGTRSWSNKYVKNVLLLFDCGSFDTNSQRIARAWTPWANYDMCSIFDFRLTYDYPTISEKYLVNTLKCKERYTGDAISETIKMIESSDKIAFIDVYGNVDDPFKTLSIDDMKKMVLSNREFTDFRIENNFILDEISNPIKEVENIFSSNSQGLQSENVKGDMKKIIKQKINKFNQKEFSKSNNDNKELELKIKYIEFIKNNGILFNPEHFTENVLNNIYNNINNYKDLIEDEDCLGMTFTTVKDILYQFKKCQINNEFDKMFIWR